MSSYDLIERIRSLGADIELLDDGYNMKLKRRALIPDDLAAEAKSHAADLREILKEWRVTCPRFVVARFAIDGAEPGACISCGGSWELHGRPDRPLWRIVDEIESITLVATTFVLHKTAEAIVGAR